MRFTKEDVLSMVDALFHEFSSSNREDAKEAVTNMMCRREKEKNNKKLQTDSGFGYWFCDDCNKSYVSKEQADQCCR